MMNSSLSAHHYPLHITNSGSFLPISTTMATGELFNHLKELSVMIDEIEEAKVEKVALSFFQQTLHSTCCGDRRTSISTIALNKLLQVVIEKENEVVKAALTKERCHLMRLFGNESWSEWLENRSYLGRVVDCFFSCAYRWEKMEEIAQKLDARTISLAEEEAKALLYLISPKKRTSAQPTEGEEHLNSYSQKLLVFPIFLGRADAE